MLINALMGALDAVPYLLSTQITIYRFRSDVMDQYFVYYQLPIPTDKEVYYNQTCPFDIHTFRLFETILCFCFFSAYFLKGTTTVFCIISVFSITFGVSISTICNRFRFMVGHDSRWDEFWTPVYGPGLLFATFQVEEVI